MPNVLRTAVLVGLLMATAIFTIALAQYPSIPAVQAHEEGEECDPAEPLTEGWECVSDGFKFIKVRQKSA